MAIMKYLKEWAQFDNDSLYEPISYDEYMEFISSKSGWGKPLGFTDSEVSSIKSVLGSEDKFQLLTNGPLSKNPDGELINVSGGYYGGFWSKKASWGVTITKYRDEWFVLQLEKVVDMRMKRIESEYHKCDTIDGVIQLIKDVSSSVVNESNSSDEWYYEIPKVEMERIPSENFIDIDSRVLGCIESGLTEYIRKNCPRVSVRLTRDIWIGIKNEGIVIEGFDYYQSGFEKGKWHPHQTIKWMRRVKISQLKDEWFLVSFVLSDYSMYFKCDQIDGLMKLLEDYYICEEKMVKESVEEDKEILSDYFVDFEDGGGKVLIKSEKVKHGAKVTDIVVHEVTIYTNEPHIRKKINWKRLSSDWDILDFHQQNHRIKALPKRTFRIWISRKGEVKKPFWFPGHGTIGPLGDRTKRLLGLNESVEEYKEILSDYFVDFEDGGGKVTIECHSLKSNQSNQYHPLYEISIFTNEIRINKKINWRRIEIDWDVLATHQYNNHSKSVPKRTFKIILSKKGEVKKRLWLPGFGPIHPVYPVNSESFRLSLNESVEESLANKISDEDWIKFEGSHKQLYPDDSDIVIYKEFMLKNFSLEEVENFQNVNHNFGFNWVCEFDEINDNGDSYNNGFITIWKFDDEWYVVEKMVKGWNKEWTYWLVDTKLGFKDIDLWS